MKISILLATMLLFTAATYAQPGEIDNSFNSSGIGAYGGSGLPSTPPTAAQSSADCIVYKSDVYPASAGATYKDKIVIIGRFTSYNGVARQYLARINPDGTIDSTFGNPLAGVTGYLYCVKVLPTGHVLIGGQFSKTISGRTIRNFARLLPNGDWDPDFNPGTGVKGPDALVHALCLQTDGRILIGGTFTTYNGTGGSRRVIRLNADGTPDSSFTTTGTVNGEVRALALQGSKIMVGGFFTGHSSQANKNRLLRLLPNGDYDSAFNASGVGFGGGDVYDILVKTDNSMVVVGNFTTYNGTARKSIVNLNADGNTSSGNGIQAGLNFIFVIKNQPDGKFLIGGNFTNINGTTVPKGIARLNDNLSLDATFLTGSGFTGGTDVYQGTSVIRDIVLQSDGKIIVGGDYTQYNGTDRRMLTRIKTRECYNAAVYNQSTGWDNNTLPTNDTFYAAIASGTYTIPTGTHLVACELEIKAGATLIIAPGASLTVKGVLMNNGTFTVEDGGNLIQINDTAVNADLGDGTFTLKRTTAPVKRYDFSYWSSPVDNITLHTVSPGTRFDKYFSYDAFVGNWVAINNGTEIMAPGKGYIMRAPESQSATVASAYTVNFTGKPRNGQIQTPALASTATGKWNLIGNPYPCAIDVFAFLDDLANRTILDGTIYIWTHQTGPQANGSGQYVYTDSDYMTYNKTGGVTTAPSGVPAFSGKIAAGQSFFVQATVNNAQATFKNSMRSNQAAYFYRQSGLSPMTQSTASHNRLWLDLSNAAGSFNQMLVGYEEGATNGFDRGYDGEMLSGATVGLYSIFDGGKYSIQARALPFEQTDEVPLGFTVPSAGTYMITLSAFDGLFGDQNAYLRDKQLQIVHDLKNSSYTFTAAAGTFEDRFVLVYTDGTSLGNPTFGQQEQSVVVTSGESIGVRSEGETITKVEVFDVLGKKLFASGPLDTKVFSVPGISDNGQVLLIRIGLGNGAVVSRKVIY